MKLVKKILFLIIKNVNVVKDMKLKPVLKNVFLYNVKIQIAILAIQHIDV